jgi:hypothetical protein
VENFGRYKFRIIRNDERAAWYYQITFDGHTILRESKDFFLYEGIARFAAIGHISLLEQGKG